MRDVRGDRSEYNGKGGFQMGRGGSGGLNGERVLEEVTDIANLAMPQSIKITSRDFFLPPLFKM